MSNFEDLPVRYHQQDGTYLCGAACAQMVLAQMGAGLLEQEDLDNDIQNHNLLESGWRAAPDGLHWTLNHRRPTSFAGSFERVELDSEAAVSRRIAWLIHQRQAPAVALISGTSHWVLVRGFSASATPTGPDDATYTIQSFDINNPSPAASSSFHHAATDTCGSGGDNGFADENISYAHWTSAYMTGAPAGSPPWGGKFIALCVADSKAAPQNACAAQPTAPKRSGERILPPEQARDLALAGLREFGLLHREAWKKSLIKTTPGDPVLVQRLDQRDSFYYIVPMASRRKVAPALVCVDARFGDYQQAARIADPNGNALQNLNFDPDAVLAKLVGQSIGLGRKGRLKIRKEAYSLYPTLVWKPCRESMSAYLPFFMLTVGSRRVYVRVDGKVFTKLHVNDRGN